MKHIFTLALLIALYVVGYSQCINNTSTNIESPRNDGFLPWANDNIPGGPFTHNPFLNRFNWEDPYSPIYIEQNAGFNIGGVSWINGQYPMLSPFNTGVSNSSAYNAAFNSPSVSDRDYKWIDGWELLWINTGRTPDGIEMFTKVPDSPLPNPASAAPTNIPYVVLYNKYRGVIRLFANVWFNATSRRYQTVSVALKFEEANVNGMLRHTGSYDTPLDQKTTHAYIQGPSSHPINADEWMLADFQVGFDPCVCKFNNTNLQFRFTELDKATLQMVSRSITIDRSLDNLDFLKEDFMNLDNIQPGVDKPGSRIYRDMQTMVDGYTRALAAYETKLTNYNSLENTLKRSLVGAVKSGLGSVGGIVGGGAASSIISNKPLRDFVLKMKPKLSLWSDDLIALDTNDANAFASSVVAGTKGTIASGFDFLNTVFEVPGQPLKPTPPTASFTETNYTGSLSTKTDTYTRGLIVPGSLANGQSNGNPGIDRLNYPAYNEVLGLFALLKTPQVDVKKQGQSQDEIIQNLKSNPPPSAFITRAPLGNKYSIKLREPLSYRFNHVLNINYEKTKVYYSFRVTFKTLRQQFVKPFFNIVVDGDTRLVSQVSKVDVDKNVSVEDYTIGQRLFTVVNTPLTEVTKALNQPWFFNTNYILDFTTGPPVSEISVIDILNLDVDIIEKIEMKVMADIYFNDKGSLSQNINTVQVFTYSLYNASIEGAEMNQTPKERITKKNVIFLERSHPNWPSKPSITPFINNVTFSPISLSGFPNSRMGVSNDLHVFVKSATISGIVNVSPGYTLKVHSLEPVQINPEAELSPEVAIIPLMEEDYYNYPLFTESTDSDVEVFCQPNGLYKSNESLAKRSTVDIEQIRTEKQQNTVDFTIFPNPAKDLISLTISTKSVDQNLTMSIIDIVGKKVVLDNIIKGVKDQSQINV